MASLATLRSPLTEEDDMAAARARRKKSAEQQDSGDQPEVEAQVAGDPGECGETACWSRTPITITQTTAARVVTFKSPWTGSIAYDFGDGTKKKSRGDTQHTYAAAGTFNVKGTPVASSCAKVSAPLAVTVA